MSWAAVSGLGSVGGAARGMWMAPCLVVDAKGGLVAKIGSGLGSAESMKSQVSKILTFNVFINCYNYGKYH